MQNIVASVVRTVASIFLLSFTLKHDAQSLEMYEPVHSHYFNRVDLTYVFIRICAFFLINADVAILALL